MPALIGLTNLKGQILLTNKQFDLLAKTAIIKEAVQDSLRECKIELQECNRQVSILEIKNTGTEFALDKTTQLSDNWRLSYSVLGDKYDKKVKWLKRAGKVIVACVVAIVVETVVIYALVRQ